IIHCQPLRLAAPHGLCVDTSRDRPTLIRTSRGAGGKPAETALTPRRHPLNLIPVMPAKGGEALAKSNPIAGLVGPLLAALGLAALVNRNLIPAVIGEAAHNDALVFLTGLLTLLAGVAIVRVHNLWTADWRLLVTVLGWLAVFSGVVRMWNPHGAAR